MPPIKMLACRSLAGLTFECFTIFNKTASMLRLLIGSKQRRATNANEQGRFLGKAHVTAINVTVVKPFNLNKITNIRFIVPLEENTGIKSFGNIV